MARPDPRGEEALTLARMTPAGWAYVCSGGNYELARHIKLMHRSIFDAILDGRRVLLEVPPRHGKALALDTPIPTPTGWTTMGEVEAGDYVLGADGAPTRVVGTSAVMHDHKCYRVIADDGTEIVADAEHLWLACLCRKHGMEKLYTTEELARPRKKRARIRRGAPARLPKADLPIDPYVMGLWLGDGNTRNGAITVGEEDAPHVRTILRRHGYRVTHNPNYPTRYGVRGLQAQLRSAGVLGNKHIPMPYLRSANRQRLELLRGLIDSDGHVAPDGQVEFCSINRRLADQVRELVFSLGVKASMIEGRATIDGRDCGPKYRVMFYMAGCASIPRKAERTRDASKTPHAYVRAIPCDSVPVKCIKVEAADGLFLAGEGWLPTHNTELLRYVVGWYMGTFPTRTVIYAGHTQKLADRFGRHLRNDLEAFGPLVFGVDVDKSTRAKADFELVQGGEFVGLGAMGSPHGRGAHLLITDDLVPNAAATRSDVKMDAIEDFLRNDLMSRRMEPFCHVGIQTRWSERDPHGVLNESWPGHYTTVRLPALAEDGDALGRAVGEPLWPSRIPLSSLLEQREGMHPFRWSAIYQQRPTPEEGGVWKRAWWEKCWYAPDDKVPDRLWLGDDPYALSSLLIYTVVDLAFTEKKGADYTVIGTFGVTSDSPRRVLILDMHRERMEYPKLWPTIRRQMDHWGSSLLYIEEEGQQQMVVQDGRSQGFAVRTVSRKADADLRISGDKVNVAYEASPVAQSRRLWIPRQADWLPGWEGELLTFPNSAHKDMADVTAWGCLIADGLSDGNWWDGYGDKPRRANLEHGPDAGFTPEDDEDDDVADPWAGFGLNRRLH